MNVLCVRVRRTTRIAWLLLLVMFATACKSRKIITDAASASSRTMGKGDVEARYAGLLGVDKKLIKNNERLYRFIDSWLGVPHRDNGNGRSGIDCSGFTLLLQKEIYNRSVARNASRMAEEVKKKYEGDLNEGDLVFFDFGGKKFSHVGVYLQNNKFVHVSTSRGVIISDLHDPWYYKYFSRAGSVSR